MRNFIRTLLLTLLAWPTLAMYQPGWERPIQQAPLTVVEARLAYESRIARSGLHSHGRRHHLV